MSKKLIVWVCQGTLKEEHAVVWIFKGFYEELNWKSQEQKQISSVELEQLLLFAFQDSGLRSRAVQLHLFECKKKKMYNFYLYLIYNLFECKKNNVWLDLYLICPHSF